MNETELHAFLTDQGYQKLRYLPDGRLIGLYNFIFTIGLIVGLDESGYQCRYCYDKSDPSLPLNDVINWDGVGDPKSEWIVKK